MKSRSQAPLSRSLTKRDSKSLLPALRQLAARYGIQTSHQDMFGRRSTAPASSLLATLRALGAPVESLNDVPHAIRERHVQSWRTALEPVTVAWVDGWGNVTREQNIPLRLKASEAHGRARVRMVMENGETKQWERTLDSLRTSLTETVEGERHIAKMVPMRARVPIGYHRLQIECPAGEFETLVIAAPPRAHDPEEKSWGVFLPLYSLFSQASWGVGDFSDLEQFGRWITEQGGRVISTLPLLAGFLDGTPYEISPYAPASRLFWNEIYVDPRRAPEFNDCAKAREIANSNAWQRDLEHLRKQPRVDHRRVMALKRPLIEAMAQWLVRRKQARHALFMDYVAANARLNDYAAFRATGERRNAPWMRWPEPLRSGTLHPHDYRFDNELYHLYSQFLAEEQLSALGSRKNPGDAGLYLDFPLGVHPDSYDVWRERDLFVMEASTGAPPDTLFTKGQNWGFPPPHPEVMRRSGYSYLIASLRQQFRHTNWVRIDHVMGLHRLFWIPTGMEGREGVYVHYRAEEQYAILCLESQRCKTTVVGENLGTVPPEITRTMLRHGLKPMYVLQYEVQPNLRNSLRPVPPDAVASLNTHDMPPFAGFSKGLDIKDLTKLGLFDKKESAEQMEYRQKVCRALQRFARGFASAKSRTPQASASVQKIMQECLRWLAASDARLVLINLEDLWLETAAQNVPGTHLERPNWQRKARYSIEEFSDNPALLQILREINKLRSPKKRAASALE